MNTKANYMNRMKRIRLCIQCHPDNYLDGVIGMLFRHAYSRCQHDYDSAGVVLLCLIPYKDQDATVSVKRQLRDLSSKVKKTIQPVFTS